MWYSIKKDDIFCDISKSHQFYHYINDTGEYVFGRSKICNYEAMLFAVNEDVRLRLPHGSMKTLENLRLEVNYHPLRIVPAPERNLKNDKLWLIITILVSAAALVLAAMVTVVVRCCRKRVVSRSDSEFHDTSYSITYYHSVSHQ